MGLFPSDPQYRRYMIFGLRIAGDFGVTIAVPVVVFASLGRWLDIRYDTGPLFLLLGFTTSALLTAYIIKKKAKKYGDEYMNLESNDPEE